MVGRRTRTKRAKPAIDTPRPTGPLPGPLSAPKGSSDTEGVIASPLSTLQLSLKSWLAAALLLALAACSSTKNDDDGGNPNGPSPGGSGPVSYTAIGASDTTGFGGSSPCLPFSDCPNGTGYVQRITRELRNSGRTVTLLNLGIPGSVVGPEIEDLARQLGRGTIGNFIQRELPFVPRTSTIVTIFGGANDINVVASAIQAGMGGGNPQGWGEQFAAGYGRDLATIVNGIRDRAPEARIFLYNPPNGAAIPSTASRTPAEKRILQALSVRFAAEANALASRGVTVLDLMCDSRSYIPSNYSDDGFHPSDAGYAYMAELALNAINGGGAAPPRADCPGMHLAP
jgi:lysophospholipase L1-like esterase